MSDALTAPLFTTSDLEAINAARDALDKIAADARSASFDVPGSNGMEANAGDYARTGYAAEIASTALFAVLNQANASEVQKIPATIMHRLDDAA